jgi:hypothetical protein
MSAFLLYVVCSHSIDDQRISSFSDFSLTSMCGPMDISQTPHWRPCGTNGARRHVLLHVPMKRVDVSQEECNKEMLSTGESVPAIQGHRFRTIPQ